MQLYTNLPITSPHAAAPFTHRLPLNGHTVLVSAKGLRVLRQSSVMLSLVFSMALLTGFTGCGPASSDNAANPGPLTSMGEVPRTSPSQKDRQISKQPETPSTDSRNGQAYEPNRLPVSLTAEIPDSVAKDINSPYASLRLSALNHWELNGATAPLNAVFEALQDENEAVQAKALEIIERRLAAEQSQGRD